MNKCQYMMNLKIKDDCSPLPVRMVRSAHSPIHTLGPLSIHCLSDRFVQVGAPHLVVILLAHVECLTLVHPGVSCGGVVHQGLLDGSGDTRG